MVKEGYKETEIGVIPQGWDVNKIKDISTPKARIGWQNLRKQEYLTNGEYLLITGTDFSDGKVILDKCFYVSKDRYDQDKNIQISNGSILITKDGTLGKVALVDGLDKPATLNAGIFVLNMLDKNVDNRFLYQYLKTGALLDYTSKTSTGGTIKHLNQNVLVNFRIPLPPLEEQQHIAEALSDMDSLISSLEKLIEKKKAIKEACLQKMFPKAGETVPEMRLPGFTDPWEQRKLGELGEFTSNGVDKKINPGEKIVNLLNYMDVYNCRKVNSKNCNMLMQVSAKETQIKNNNVLKNDVFFTPTSETVDDIGHVMVIEETLENTVYSYHLMRYRPYDNIFYSIFPNYCFDTESVRSQMSLLAQGVQRFVLSKSQLESVEIMLPHMDEQKMIAEYLRNLDNLITLHQRKLEKCKKIKQGMMQQLLTGKIRLVSTNDVVTDKPDEDKVLKVSPKGHTHQFDDAVVIAGIVDKFYSDKYPLGRKKVQKLLYLFRRHQEADTSAFKKKAAGPYADKVRYKGGEPIAISNKYILVKRGSKGSSFSKGEKIVEALTYLRNWNLNDDFKWLCEQFKYAKTDRLELLATIDMAICDLSDAGKIVTVESIKNLIKSQPEWKAKLAKSYFKDSDIAWAIRECKRLFNKKGDE